MREQFADLAGALRWQPREYIAQVGIRVVPVHARGLDQTHHGGRPLARAQRTREQPVVAPNGNLGVILPMSGKKSKSSTAGMRSMVVVFDGNTANSERQVMLFTSKLHRA